MNSSCLPSRLLAFSIFFLMCILLQPLRWRCVECVIHHERDARRITIYNMARTSNNRVIAACDLYCCLLPQCEALRACRSGFPIATMWSLFCVLFAHLCLVRYCWQKFSSTLYVFSNKTNDEAEELNQLFVFVNFILENFCFLERDHFVFFLIPALVCSSGPLRTCSLKSLLFFSVTSLHVSHSRCKCLLRQ